MSAAPVSLPVALLALALCSTAPLLAQTPDSSLLTVERDFGSAEFAPEPSGDVRWVPGQAAYTRLEPGGRRPGDHRKRDAFRSAVRPVG